MSTTLGIYTQLLGLYDLSHKVTSANINNVNTPGYKAMEVSAASFSEILHTENKKTVKLIVTDPHHIADVNGGQNSAVILPRTEGIEEKINKNNVVLSHESINSGKISANRSEALNSFKVLNGMITTAISSKGSQ